MTARPEAASRPFALSGSPQASVSKGAPSCASPFDTPEGERGGLKLLLGVGLLVAGAVAGCSQAASAPDGGTGASDSGASCSLEALAGCSCPAIPAGESGPGWCQVTPPEVDCQCACPVVSLCAGWCLDGDAGGAEPCAGFCVADAGLLNFPATPCSGGCGWFGVACAPGSADGCCAGLGCEAALDAGSVCCGPDGFPCSGGGECCSGLCTGLFCERCAPSAAPCTATADCCQGSCQNGRCSCVGLDAGCGTDLDCCLGACVDGGCTDPQPPAGDGG